MELEDVKYDLNLLFEKLSQKVVNLDCYLFGSILINDRQANDIDVLIIYQNLEDLKLLKEEFIVLSINAPYHVLFFTYAEEKELDFVRTQRMDKIFSL